MGEVIGSILVGLFIPLAISAVFYVVLGLISRKMENDQEQDLARREAAVEGFYVSDLRHDPTATNAVAGQLVSGSVVMGTGARRQFTANIRAIFGGEIKGYQRVLQAARRKALLRMIESAQSQGATGVINVRFETSQLGSVQKPSSEILCFGTALRSGAPTIPLGAVQATEAERRRRWKRSGEFGVAPHLLLLDPPLPARSGSRLTYILSRKSFISPKSRRSCLGANFRDSRSFSELWPRRLRPQLKVSEARPLSHPTWSLK